MPDSGSPAMQECILMEENNQNRKIVSFNKKFYSIDAVEEAIADFSEICRASIIENDDKIVVELDSKHEFDSPLKEEFCNYVLGLLKNKGLV